MINNSTGGTALPQSNASTFSIAFGPPKANFTFTLTSDYQGSLYFRMAGPSYWSWLAVGTGDKMDGSLMFIMYQDDNGSMFPDLFTKDSSDRAYRSYTIQSSGIFEQ